jgi:2-methylaconitate cis-trans-isomerase PrpF
MSMQTAHRSYMTTGAIATAAAAFVPGDRRQAVRPRRSGRGDDPDRTPVRVMHAVVRADDLGDPATIRAIALGAARHILDGQVWVRRQVLPTG